ncbi:MAG TPA: glycosyltransferase family 4 protein [Candidatus Acidoferrales bacterium]|nr:glycosyltransferase family 4 protein [Candidatus Acidoferrales bacterium]
MPFHGSIADHAFPEVLSNSVPSLGQSDRKSREPAPSMAVTFLMPCYCWAPSGGFRIVYEYANQLVARGHRVTVIHPRRLAFRPPEKFTLRQRARRLRLRTVEIVRRPKIDWHKIDPRVRLAYVSASSAAHFPDADVVFATAWHTVQSVLALPPSKGRKCYLIQGFESFLGPRDLVAATWRAPLHKVVVANWLRDLAADLGAGPVTYIPNAIDPSLYRLLEPIEQRGRCVSMAASPVPVKAANDGVQALVIAKQKHTDLQAVLFGPAPPPLALPDWITYLCNPPQQAIIDVYNRSSIFLSSSLSEGFGLPPAEAASCGCALVATDVGGLRDYLEHGVTGLFSPPADPAALAKNLCALLDNDALRIRLAKAARLRISEFTWSRSVALMEQFLRKVCAESSFVGSASRQAGVES